MLAAGAFPRAPAALQAVFDIGSRFVLIFNQKDKGMSDNPKPFDYAHLTIPERILLAQELWDSVYELAADIPLSESEREELERRWVAYETGTMTASTWPEVKQRLLSK